MTPPYMTTLQFIVCLLTLLVRGKNAKTKMGNRNASAAMLIAMPKHPRDHRRGGSGSPRMRLRRTQPMERMYADINDVIVREMMAVRATWEPMLISESSMVTASETMTEFKGMFHRGVT